MRHLIKEVNGLDQENCVLQWRYSFTHALGIILYLMSMCCEFLKKKVMNIDDDQVELQEASPRLGRVMGVGQEPEEEVVITIITMVTLVIIAIITIIVINYGHRHQYHHYHHHCQDHAQNNDHKNLG